MNNLMELYCIRTPSKALAPTDWELYLRGSKSQGDFPVLGYILVSYVKSNR